MNRSLLRAITEQIGIKFLSQKSLDDFERIMPDYTVTETLSSYRYMLKDENLLAIEPKGSKRIVIYCCQERVKGTIIQLVRANLDECNIFK